MNEFILYSVTYIELNFTRSVIELFKQRTPLDKTKLSHLHEATMKVMIIFH